ncbi:unnamed protein product [Amoebophrya sp. A120]|nr:unnamed protein product [Amoebophrya sp. A120]|eukprot:GSA120T00006444001.1
MPGYSGSQPGMYDTSDLRVRSRGPNYAGGPSPSSSSTAPNNAFSFSYADVFRDPESGLSGGGPPGGALLPGARGGGNRPAMTPQMKMMFSLLCGAAAALHADLNMAAPHLSRLAEDFGLTPMEKDARLGGLVQLGFFIIGGACSVFVGPIADKSDRAIMLTGLLFLSAVLNLSIASFLPNSKVGFFYFFLCRVASGVSIGGCFPVLYSLCGDMFPSSQRSFVAASIGASANVGAAVGSMFSGMIGGDGAWRTPYFLASILQLAASVAVQMFLKDPRMASAGSASAGSVSGPDKSADWAAAWAGGRQAYTEMQAEQGYIRMEDMDFGKFRDIAHVESNKILLLQAIPGCVPVSLILTFLPDYLISEQKMTVQSTVLVQSAWGVASLALTFSGGALGQRLYETNKNQFCRFLALCCALGVLPFLLLINCSPDWIANASTGRATVFSVLLAGFGGLVAVAGPNVRATLMNLNESGQRGTVFSALTLCDDLGKGLGPTVIVLLVTLFGRRLAFSIAFCFWFFSAGLLYSLKGSLARDSHNTSIGLRQSRYE